MTQQPSTREASSLNYASPRVGVPRDYTRILFYFIYLFMLAIPAAMIAFLLASWVPAYRGIFMDFKTTLPTATEWLLCVSDAFGFPFVWPCALLALFAVPFLLVWITTRFREPTQRLTIALMIMLLTMFGTLSSLLLVQWALMMPLVRLLQSVSGGPGGR